MKPHHKLLKPIICCFLLISVLFPYTASGDPGIAIHKSDAPGVIDSSNAGLKKNGIPSARDHTEGERDIDVEARPLSEDLAAVPSDLLGEAKSVFSDENLTLALVGFGVAGLAFGLDKEVGKYFQERHPLGNSAAIGNTLGLAYIHAGVGMTLLATGELLERTDWSGGPGAESLVTGGITLLEALAINGVLTEGIKLAAGRRRPDGSDNMSFPSGHTSGTATLAAAISEMYDWDIRVAAPLYLLTAFVGASRIQDGAHYFSDVLAGATLGTIVGKSVARSRKGKKKSNILILPLYEKDYSGVLFTCQF